MLQHREKTVLLTQLIGINGPGSCHKPGPPQECQPAAKASRSGYLGIPVAHLWHPTGCSALDDLQRALQGFLTPGSSSGPQNTDDGRDYLFPPARENTELLY